MAAKHNHTSILVFRTNIRFKKDLRKIAGILEPVESIITWNVDREDIDNVLRIEAKNLDTIEVNRIIQQAGYLCEELPD